MQCPQCGHPLSEVEYEGALVHTCEGCGGEFAGGDALAHIVNVREERFGEVTEAASDEIRPRFGLPDAEARQSLDCPVCGTAMRVGNYGGDSGVFVDRCDRCGGVWLDRDELEHVQILTERWADEAPEQLQRIAGELEAARRDAARRASGSFSGSRFAFVNAIINRLLDAA